MYLREEIPRRGEKKVMEMKKTVMMAALCGMALACASCDKDKALSVENKYWCLAGEEDRIIYLKGGVLYDSDHEDVSVTGVSVLDKAGTYDKINEVSETSGTLTFRETGSGAKTLWYRDLTENSVYLSDDNNDYDLWVDVKSTEYKNASFTLSDEERTDD